MKKRAPSHTTTLLKHTAATTLLACSLSTPALAGNVNFYNWSDYIGPDTLNNFEKETGIKVNVAHLDKGMVERLRAEGRRSPADLIFTVDISRLASAVEAGVTQPVTSPVLEANVPDAYHDPDGQWWGLTTRARVVYASKDRVDPAEVPTYESLADPKWKGRICTRSGTHSYTVALVAAMIHHHGKEYTRDWLLKVKDNLARRPQGNDRAQVKAIWAGECDISLGNTYYMG